jgi:hypothetical protein
MPRKGDPLYNYWNGKWEVVTFLEEGLSSPKCTVKTYLCATDDGRRFRCSKEMYATSQSEALKRALIDRQAEFRTLTPMLQNLEKNIQEVKADIKRIEGMLN